MISQINRASQTPKWPELDTRQMVNCRDPEENVKTIAKIAALSTGIALFIAATVPRDSTGPEGLKGKVMFGLCSIGSAIFLHDLIADCAHKYKYNLARNLAERESKNV